MRTAAALLVVSLTAAACTSDDAGAESAPTATPTASPTAAPTPTVSSAPAPLVLHIDGAPGTTCFGSGAPRELAWFDVTWEATADLDSFSFELIDPVGVEQVGDGLVVPPVNFGGRIDFGGASSWDSRAEVLDDRSVSWAQRDPVWAWTPIEGQTGLLVLHLRVTGTGGFDGVTATYRTEDGETGTVSAEADNAYRFRERC